MGVTKFGFDKVKNVINSGSVSDEDMMLRLSRLGEQMCNHARTITRGHSTGGYDDQTGNLRSSIGYRIFKDGRSVQDGGFKSEGGDLGKSNAEKALQDFSNSPQISRKGWTLLVVAGMEYAKYVEDKGYNVLFLTSIELEKKILELKNRLKL